mgnify:CR=1 FL=1
MIVDRCLDIDEFIAFHEKYATKDIARADDILDNWDYHFCFYDEVTGKFMLSGFTKPKNYDNIIEAIQWLSNFMRADTLYSRTKVKAAKLVLLRAGFKKIDDTFFVRKEF